LEHDGYDLAVVYPEIGHYFLFLLRGGGTG